MYSGSILARSQGANFYMPLLACAESNTWCRLHKTSENNQLCREKFSQFRTFRIALGISEIEVTRESVQATCDNFLPLSHHLVFESEVILRLAD